MFVHPYPLGQYSVSIVSGSNASNFQLDSSTGLITTAAVLDREEKSEYLFTIHAVDNAASPKTGISVSDMTDNNHRLGQCSYFFLAKRCIYKSISMRHITMK